MNKKFINGILAASLVAGMAGSFTSCKDYDDDIDNLQNQIDGVKAEVTKIQDLVSGGKVISSVTTTENGIAITIDGTTYNITNGKNGENGTAWTIGTDGYWYENGTKTDNKAIGANGESGIYYVPQANGTFAEYKDGVKVKDTDIVWKPTGTVTTGGITAVYTGTKLTLSGVEGTTSDVVIDLGEEVGSIAFVPSVMSSTVAFPTTDKPFYNVATYLDEAKYNASTKAFIPQTGFNKSNIVDLVYRVNPDNAFIAETATYSYINRVVTSRANGDKEDLLNVVSSSVAKNNEISLKATINASALSTKSAEENIAALSMWNGQANTVSDYIQVSSEAVTPILVDSIPTTKTTTTPKTAVTTGIYARTQAIVANGETDAFIKQFVKLTDADYAATLVYNSEAGVNLKDIPGLFVSGKGFLKDLGFTGMSYTFSLPKEYRSDDTQKTNQQDFVKLNGTVLTINTDKLTGALTQAIGRTPVVRIDAFLTNNKGEAKLVASAYIKIQITEKVVSAEDKEAIKGTISPVAEFEYHKLTDKNTLVGQMPWMDVNNVIYGETGLTAKTFWSYYGGDKNEYTVEISTIKGGKTLVLDKNTEVPTGSAYTNNKVAGIEVETLLNNGETQTSNIAININENVLTQNTYDNINGKGAQYTVTVTIPSDDKKVLGDVVLTQVFYVKETCVAYDFNPNFYAGTVDGHQNVVVTKGKLNDEGNWELSMGISEAFKMIDGKNIFTYFNTVNNAKAIAFSLDPTTQKGVAFDATNNIISLNAPLSTKDLFAGMKYVVTLDNGETCTFKFTAQFINPFIAGTAKAVNLAGNTIGEVKVQTAPSVIVNEAATPNAAVFAWNAASSKLALQAAATKYNVAEPTVEYAFVENDAYKAFAGQLDPKSTFEIDETTGEVTYNNQGAVLQINHNLTVKATVTFADLSVVTVEIPFNVNK